MKNIVYLKKISEIDAKYKTEKKLYILLSTPPHLYPRYPNFIWTRIKLQKKRISRIIIEKPFGHDLQSAQDLNKKLLEFLMTNKYIVSITTWVRRLFKTW